MRWRDDCTCARTPFGHEYDCQALFADDSAEGVRISFGAADGNGWALLRLSVHDPVMPMNIESDEEGGCLVIAQKLHAFMEGFDKLDCSKMTAYLDA